MSSNNSADSRTSSERSLESDSSTGSCSRDCTTQSIEPCFPTIEEIKKFRLNDDSVEKQYEVIEILGEGGYGAVFKVQHKFDRKFYAFKVIPLQKSDDEDEIMQLTREIETLSKLEHENIVRYYTSVKLKDYDDMFKKEYKYFCIQMQYCKKTLKTFIYNFNSTQETEKRIKILKQIFDGLKYIHDNGIMHRDLNPNNIFLAYSDIIKIGDFGSSRQTAVLCTDGSDDEVSRKGLTTYIGTKIYSAPELKSGRYDKRIDLYSLGIIVFEMFHFPPRTSDHEKEPIFRGIRSQEVIIPESLESEIQDVVKGLLEHNPEYRMSLDVAADKVMQFSQFSTMTTVEFEILKTTEVCENQQANELIGIILDTEPSGYKMIHDENVETTNRYTVGPQGDNGRSGYAVGPQGDNGWSDRGRASRGINCVQDSHSEKSEKIRITKEAIAIFTGKPPKDEVHISDLIEAIETFPHPNVDSNEVPEPSTKDVGNMTEYMRTRKTIDVVKSNSLEDDDSAKCKEEQQREVEESRSTLEDTHATGHLQYHEQTQTVTQQTTAQFHQQDVAELDSTSETEPQSSTVCSTVQKVPQSALTDTETIEMDK